MSFMQPEISDKQKWIYVDGSDGSEYIPADVCGDLPDYDEFIESLGDDCEEDADQLYLEACTDCVRDYVQTSKIYSIEEITGYGCRMSAPGYLDCTAWTVCDSEEECIEFLLDNYANDGSDELEEWEKELLDRLYGLNPKNSLFGYYGYKPGQND